MLVASGLHRIFKELCSLPRKGHFFQGKSWKKRRTLALLFLLFETFIFFAIASTLSSIHDANVWHACCAVVLKLTARPLAGRP
jgi:hypothetical protein